MTTAKQPTLLNIIAHARSGALDRAWHLFESGGFGNDRSDPAAASVHGRLLKDRAAGATGPERIGLYREAAEAYARAAALASASYPLINAATLYRLAGSEPQARELAGQVLKRLDEHPDEPETPYYGAATRAEALLLLDRVSEARNALARAIGLAPRAWEDHACTLRQFGLILRTQSADARWLDEHRPPRSLHFGGHMSFDPDVVRREHLDEKIAEVLEEEQVGFGFGALAAGADIIIAEALLARGAELHAVLPGGPESFAQVSVNPYGEAWRRRFDAVLEQAETVRAVRPIGTAPDAAMIRLADEIAMGTALMNAWRLESHAVQLLVLADGASKRAREAWAEGGWRQRIITAPREEVGGEVPATPSYPWRRLAILAIAVDRPGAEPAELEGRLGPLRGRLEVLPRPAVGPYLSDDRVVVAWTSPLEAACAARAIRDELSGDMPLRIGGHYGVGGSFGDPFSATERLAGDALAAAAGALASALPGTAYITEDFAAALAAAGPAAPRSEYIGELDPPDGDAPLGLHVLKS